MGAINAPMKGEYRGPRISRRDVADLERANEALVAAADVVKRMHPNWESGVIDPLRTAIAVTDRLHTRGLRALTRYAERRGLVAPGEVPTAASADDEVNPDRKIDSE